MREVTDLGPELAPELPLVAPELPVMAPELAVVPELPLVEVPLFVTVLVVLAVFTVVAPLALLIILAEPMDELRVDPPRLSS